MSCVKNNLKTILQIIETEGGSRSGSASRKNATATVPDLPADPAAMIIAENVAAAAAAREDLIKRTTPPPPALYKWIWFSLRQRSVVNSLGIIGTSKTSLHSWVTLTLSLPFTVWKISTLSRIGDFIDPFWLRTWSPSEWLPLASLKTTGAASLALFPMPFFRKRGTRSSGRGEGGCLSSRSVLACYYANWWCQLPRHTSGWGGIPEWNWIILLHNSEWDMSCAPPLPPAPPPPRHSLKPPERFWVRAKKSWYKVALRITWMCQNNFF